MPYTILITGAGSGLGHGFAKHYLQQPNTTVITADQRYTLDLEQPLSENKQLHKFHLEITSSESIDSFIKSIKEAIHNPIDLIIHSAGIRGLVPSIVSEQPNDVAAAETLQVMDSNTMLRTFEVNTVGTFTLLQKLHQADLFHPPISTNSSSSTSSTNSNQSTSTSTPTLTPPSSPPNLTKIIIMTSRMGSIGHNTTGSAYAYRASKAALNAIVRSMSLDLPHVLFSLIHPGRVETGLTRCREHGAIEVEESVQDMVRLIGGLELGDSGGFVERSGKGIVW